MRSARANEHLLTASYAIDAIDNPAERARFERHARRCPDCAAELRGLTDTATRLGIAADETPPPELRDRILASVSGTRQLSTVAGLSRHRARPAGRRAPGTRLPLPVLVAEGAWLIAAACVVIVIVLAVALASTRSQLGRTRNTQAAVTAVLTAPDARAVSRPTSAGGTATVVYSLARHALIFTPAKLPSLRDGKVYELWLIGPSLIRRAGLLPAAGRAGPVLVSGLLAGDKLGLTVEPAGGTKQPTTTPILLLPLRS
ncbi:MAG: anti-sigma factor [Streptosporangiaceae bacterium]